MADCKSQEVFHILVCMASIKLKEPILHQYQRPSITHCAIRCKQRPLLAHFFSKLINLQATGFACSDHHTLATLAFKRRLEPLLAIRVVCDGIMYNSHQFSFLLQTSVFSYPLRHLPLHHRRQHILNYPCVACFCLSLCNWIRYACKSITFNCMHVVLNVSL